MLPIVAAPAVADIIIPIAVAVATTVIKHQCKCNPKRKR